MRNESRNRSSQQQQRNNNKREPNGGILRKFSGILRHVSNSSIANSVRTAGASILTSNDTDDRAREQVQWAAFDKLELASNVVRRVLLLAYANGFQVWNIEDADDVYELVSTRDGPVAFLRAHPWPYSVDKVVNNLKDSLPLLLVITGGGSATESNSQGAFGSGLANSNGCSAEVASEGFVPTVVRFYSMRSHSYVHALRFRSAIYAVRCSSRIIAVALRSQIYGFDSATLQNTFSIITYPTPQNVQGPGYVGYGPMAVGPRWLAYAANHPPVSNSGRVSPQSVSLSSSPLNGNMVAHYAKESSKQIAAGIITLGDKGYKKLTKYCSDFIPDVSSPPRSGNQNFRILSNAPVGYGDPEHAGMVVVKDFVSNVIVAQFKAHKSPISALSFDPSGTLLITASIEGHNINVFRIMPSPSVNSSNPGLSSVNTSYEHLYKLHRGYTNAIIQDISFSEDSSWISVSSSRGTSHLFALSPFGGSVVPHLHGSALMNGSTESTQLQSPVCPWIPLKMDMHSASLPINLFDGYKIRSGNEGWCSTISGAAAVATGRSNVSSAIAVAFHNGKGHSLQTQFGHSHLKNQIWVFSSSGHVTRYALRPYAPIGMEQSNGSPEVGPVYLATSQTDDSNVIVEPLQKWDLGRKSNWIEREDNIEFIGSSSEEKESNALYGFKKDETPAYFGKDKASEIGTAISDEQHRWYLSNAEVHTRKPRVPTWAKPEIYFQAITPDGADDKLALDSEVEIERFPTRLIEIRKKDLMPVFDDLQKQDKLAECTGSENKRISLAHEKEESANNMCNYVSGNMSALTAKPLTPHSSLLHANLKDQVEYYSTGGRDIVPVTLRNVKLRDHLLVGNFSTQLQKRISAGSHVDDNFEQRNGDTPLVLSLENGTRVGERLKTFTDHDYCSAEIDSLKSSNGDSVDYEGHFCGTVVHTGLSETATLCSDDNSDSFGSNPWEAGTEGETISPSSVLNSAPLSKSQLQDKNISPGSVKIQLQDDYIAATDLKNKIVHTKVNKCEDHVNEEDALEGALFPFCEED